MEVPIKINTLSQGTALAAVVLALAACGGGNGKPAPNPHAVVDWPVSPERARSLTGGEPLDMSSAQIATAFTNILRAADTVHAGDLLTSAGRIAVSCSGLVCTGPDGDPVEIDPEVTGENQAVMSRRGVNLAQNRERDDELAFDSRQYGGWMEYSAFGVGVGVFDEGFDAIAPYSYGSASGTNPTVSGTWSGVMIGADSSTGYVLQGDAALNVEMGDTAGISLDVAFTNIMNLDTGAALGDMSWSDLAVVVGGFARGSGANSIKGSFYGPNHEEVGGVFERDFIVGAFGAKR